MNCEETTKLMDGYLDGELDAITNQAIEQHLRECHNCDQAYKTQRSLIRAIGNATPYYKAPSELRERIQSSLRKEIAEQSNGSGIPVDARPLIAKEHAESRSILFGTSWNWLALAAAIVFAAVIVWNVVPRLQRPAADQFLATQLIASHVRSLMANHLTDVASSDQHTVKPWLDAKLDFAPAVVDLSTDGFPLIGGRLDYLDNRPVAALIYGRRKHFINLFVWPAGSNTIGAANAMSHQGYQLLHWVDSDFNYWAVSDVNANDLQTFKNKFEEQTSHH
ncbi:MAG TPA: anti-sigma factor [Pyrinomonadaceae bacterium]|jgi:anti-sigma factor RsiW|nr:anti-sigma factor [Pyrinomonadaceae bacterium]